MYKNGFGVKYPTIVDVPKKQNKAIQMQQLVL